MEFPHLSDHYFSPEPERERSYRRTYWGLLAVIVLMLSFFWFPLRSTSLTYPLVSITVTHRPVEILFRIVTTLGSEGFFLVLFAVVFWSASKLLGFWGLIVMPLSIFVTSEVPKDIIRLPRPDIRGVAVPTYTFPSGHTSGALSVWGYLAVVLQKRWLWYASLAIVALVGLSRITLGYHYPGDVLGGMATGMVFTALFFGFGSRILRDRWREDLPCGLLISFFLAVPLTISCFVPVTFAPRLMGYLAGTGTGYLLEERWLGFDPRGTWMDHLMRALIGLTALAILTLGLDALLPAGLNLLTFAQYTLATLWVTFLAPLLFVRLELAGGGGC